MLGSEATRGARKPGDGGDVPHVFQTVIRPQFGRTEHAESRLGHPNPKSREHQNRHCVVRGTGIPKIAAAAAGNRVVPELDGLFR